MIADDLCKMFINASKAIGRVPSRHRRPTRSARNPHGKTQGEIVAVPFNFGKNGSTPTFHWPVIDSAERGTSMTLSPNADDDELSRQVRQHVERLREAGVEFVPAADPTKPRPVLVASAAVVDGEMAPIVADRRHALSLLAEEVRGCSRCAELVSTRTQTVFGVGPIDPELCFVGEAPGADEDRQGEPFVGAAGQLLNRIISACGMKREEVFICNILRCRPPGNRQPKSGEADNCREWLDRTLELVRPRYICCLGASAAQNLLGVSTPIGKMRGRFYDYKGIPVICTYHPASLLPSRSPENKKLVWDDMKMLLAKMGKPIPEPKKGG
jgi:DNA polymerase